MQYESLVGQLRRVLAPGNAYSECYESLAYRQGGVCSPRNHHRATFLSQLITKAASVDHELEKIQSD